MNTSRRSLTWAIAGLTLFGAAGLGQDAETRPAPRAANPLVTAVEAARAKRAVDPKAALAAYDEALVLFNKEFEKTGGRAETPEILNLYKALIVESDQLVEKVETPELEAKIPERDMLSKVESSAWGKSIGADTIFSEGSVELRGIEIPDKKLMGVVSLGGWNPAWHDIVLDLEFKILQGEFELFLRYRPDRRWFTIKFDPKSGFELNKTYRVTLRVKGSKIQLSARDQNPQSDTLTVNTSRTGGVGFGLNPGAKVIISSCKLKVLR